MVGSNGLINEQVNKLSTLPSKVKFVIFALHGLRLLSFLLSYVRLNQSCYHNSVRGFVSHFSHLRVFCMQDLFFFNYVRKGIKSLFPCIEQQSL